VLSGHLEYGFESCSKTGVEIHTTTCGQEKREA
jgi:hypothetical protein